MFALIGAIEKFSIEELDSNHSENELENENVQLDIWRWMNSFEI